MLRYDFIRGSSWLLTIRNTPIVSFSSSGIVVAPSYRRGISNLPSQPPITRDPGQASATPRGGISTVRRRAQVVARIVPAANMTKSAHYSSAAAPKDKKKPMEPKPSSSIVLLSPTNQVLLLHRVKTSSAFPSAHVFPGGNLSEFHDGSVPPPGDFKRHEDSLAYRLGAIRETFEESGILLAHDKKVNNRLLNLPPIERDRARKAIYGNEVRFNEWLESQGGVADTESLHAFTRWITPAPTPKRFTTQMYLYFLPLSTPISADPVLAAAQSEAAVPTPDGTEVTTSAFEDAATWLARQQRGEVILFPPQAFLLTLVSQFCTGPPTSTTTDATEHYKSQRQALLDFLDKTPTSTRPEAARQHPASQIPWAQKVISPVTTKMLEDGRAVLTLEQPGPELKGSTRGGEWGRVVLARFSKGQVSDVEIRERGEIFGEEGKGERKNTKL